MCRAAGADFPIPIPVKFTRVSSESQTVFEGSFTDENGNHLGLVIYVNHQNSRLNRGAAKFGHTVQLNECRFLRAHRVVEARICSNVVSEGSIAVRSNVRQCFPIIITRSYDATTERA